MESSLPLVVMVDSDASLRQSLAQRLRAEGLRVVEFANAEECVQHSLPRDVACLLLDLQMPGMDGIALQDWATSAQPGLPVVFLTGHGDVRCGVEAMKRGAFDFLLKPADDAAVLATLRRAIDERSAMRLQLQQRDDIQERHASLTSREREVMRMMVRGRLNKQIAADLGISVKTVKVHRARALEKMGVRSVAALVHACYSGGIQGFTLH